MLMLRARLIAVLAATLVLASSGWLDPARSAAQGLPPGHPPPGGSTAQPVVPGPPAGSGAGAQGLRWIDPPGWSREVPQSAMRRAQYRLRGPGGEAECVVFYFGPGQGGDAEANAERWAGQLAPSEGGSAAAHPATRKATVNGLAVLLVEASGTYVGGMPGGPPGPAQADFMLLGAIVAGPDANWFFKATGPRATMERHRTAFDRMVRSVRRGAPD
jgi:hypothetical protein